MKFKNDRQRRHAERMVAYMAKERAQTTHIRLCGVDGREWLERAPDGFKCVPYPLYVDIGGKRYEYKGCGECYPLYLELNDVAKKPVRLV